MPQKPTILATQLDTNVISIYDVATLRNSLDKPAAGKPKPSHPLYTFNSPCEGYGLAWSPCAPGRLLTSDCEANIFAWNPAEGTWIVSQSLRQHQSSVEDLQWSPCEDHVFASCSVDKTIKLWDMRRDNPCVLSIRAHEADVNVISWNVKRAYLILSGADDGNFRVWDLRNIKEQDGKKNLEKAQYSFTWHSGAITSVEWNPNDDSTLAVSSDDNSISIWDLSLSVEKSKVQGTDIPSQLMFVHHGQENIKEAHWHKQIPGLLVSTAADGFNIFKPSNL